MGRTPPAPTIKACVSIRWTKRYQLPSYLPLHENLPLSGKTSETNHKGRIKASGVTKNKRAVQYENN